MEPYPTISKIDPNTGSDLPKKKKPQNQSCHPCIKGNRNRCCYAIMFFVFISGTASIAGFFAFRKMAPPVTDLKKGDKPIGEFLLVIEKRNVAGGCDNVNVAYRANNLVYSNGRISLVDDKKTWRDGIEGFDNGRSPSKGIDEFVDKLLLLNFNELPSTSKSTKVLQIEMEKVPNRDGEWMITFENGTTSGNENELASSGNAGTNNSDMESGNYTQPGDLGGTRQPDTESKDEVPSNGGGVPGNADVININPDETEDQTSERDGFMVDAVPGQRVIGTIKVDKTSNVIITSSQKIGR